MLKSVSKKEKEKIEVAMDQGITNSATNSAKKESSTVHSSISNCGKKERKIEANCTFLRTGQQIAN